MLDEFLHWVADHFGTHDGWDFDKAKQSFDDRSEVFTRDDMWAAFQGGIDPHFIEEQ